MHTLRVKLLPEPTVAAALLATLQRCNEAANLVSARARSAGRYRKYDLHHDLYVKVREETGLAAQPVVRAIGKAADAYKALKANLVAGRYGQVVTARSVLHGGTGSRLRPSFSDPQLRNPSMTGACPGTTRNRRSRFGLWMGGSKASRSSASPATLP